LEKVALSPGNVLIFWKGKLQPSLLTKIFMKGNVSHIYGVLTLSKVTGLGVSKS
jgi:hypothetical protein